MKKSNLKKNVYGLIGLLSILSLLVVGCDDFSIQGVWQLQSLEAGIEVGDFPDFSKTISFDFSEIEDVNILMQFTEETKSMYFEQDGEIIKCINLDRRYEILSEKIQIIEEQGGITEWDYILTGGVLTINMSTTLAGYEGIPELPAFPQIVATMTWVFHLVDDSIIQDVNEDEDCIDSPLYRHGHTHRHFLVWNLISDEED